MGFGALGISAPGKEPPDGAPRGRRLLSALERLLTEGRIERAATDSDRARQLLEDAAKHLRSSAVIGDDDAEGAYALLYGAARKAVDAHMAATGYRASKSRPGAHEALALYAREVIGGEYADDARALDGMRKQRNRTEYQAWHISAGRLRRDLVHAQRIVEAVRQELSL